MTTDLQSSPKKMKLSKVAFLLRKSVPVSNESRWRKQLFGVAESNLKVYFHTLSSHFYNVVVMISHRIGPYEMGVTMFNYISM